MTRLYHEWNLISENIKSLLQTTEFLFHTFHTNSSDPYNIMNNGIGKIARNNYELIKCFKINFENSLPINALNALNNFIKDNDKFSHASHSSKGLKDKEIVALITNLSLIQNEITYYLKDTQTYIRKSVEIAFTHLQRQLVADKSIRNLWENTNSEPGFEKLGGAHLLLHRLWAFKVNAEGERTDLVLSELVDVNSMLYQSVDGLVLTEWKLLKNKNEIQNKIQSAKEQAERYQKGALASIELSNYRYLVMVSKNFMVDESDIVDNDVTYRIINIAYNPETPSKSAIKKTVVSADD